MERDKKLQEIQILDQSLQNLLMQKQAFELELSETKSALKEIENSKDDAFKIIGQLMIKVEKNKVKEELLDKEKVLDLRVKSIEKQETSIVEQLDKLREEIMKDN